MSTLIKSAAEIEKMRIAGRLAAEVLEMIAPYVKPGITTEELNAICHKHIVEVQHAIPAPLNYRGYPKSICTSVNDVICHGIPGPKQLRNGDILNIDVTIIKDGYHADTSMMFFIGTPAKIAEHLVITAHKCLWLGINMVKPGAHLGDIGAAIQQYAEAEHFSVVRDYCGHGIGKVFHEEPQVLHYGKAGTGLILQPGMTFTIEPMINEGVYEAKVLPDKWTAVTKDRKLSAQWEHTILVTTNGYEVLTLRNNEKIIL